MKLTYEDSFITIFMDIQSSKLIFFYQEKLWGTWNSTGIHTWILT